MSLPLRSGADSFVEQIALRKRMERQWHRQWMHAMQGLPDLWGVFDEQYPHRGMRMAKFCSMFV